MTISVAEQLWPNASHPDYAPFWEATRRHELALPYCDSCDAPRWPPRAFCRRCYTEPVRWQAVDPVGTVYTYSVIHRAFSDAYRDWVPYAIVVVTLADGVRLLGRLRAPAVVARVDLPVRAAFDDVAPQLTFIDWEPQP